MSEFGTYWRMTINNYDENEVALVQQGYPEFIRQLVYTFEKGEEGTPHIQAYIRMKRDCRRSMMKKLFPRGNFGKIDNAEYQLNSQRYAQKLDTTARSPATITNWEALLTIEGVIKEVINKMLEDFEDEDDINIARSLVEREMVRSDYKYAKVFVSATYKQMWRQFGNDMYYCLFHKKYDQPEESVEVTLPTHTHTHDDEIFSHADGIKDARSPSRNIRKSSSSSTCSESTQEQTWDEDESNQDGSSQASTDESTSISSSDS